MCIALHPFLIGQPNRIKYLDDILSHITGHDDVWMTTADDITEYYIKNYYDQAVENAQKYKI
jgi:allantoinase